MLEVNLGHLGRMNKEQAKDALTNLTPQPAQDNQRKRILYFDNKGNQAKVDVIRYEGSTRWMYL